MPNQYSISYQNKLVAITRGTNVYEGTSCRGCGESLRYVSSSGCVRCHNERNIYKLYDGTMNKYKSPDKEKMRLTRWRKNNPTKVKDQRTRVRSYQANYQSGRRCKIKSNTTQSSNTILILEFYEEAKLLTNFTGIPYEVDHIIPICKGGKHHQDNLRVVTRKQNRVKGGKLV